MRKDGGSMQGTVVLYEDPRMLLCESRIADHIPSSQTQAATEVMRIASVNPRQIRALDRDEFLLGWCAIFYLFQGLHPDEASDHGRRVIDEPGIPDLVSGFADMFRRHYERSGWPVALRCVARDAWRRYRAGELDDDQFYANDALHAGWLAGE